MQPEEQCIQIITVPCVWNVKICTAMCGGRFNCPSFVYACACMLHCRSIVAKLVKETAETRNIHDSSSGQGNVGWREEGICKGGTKRGQRFRAGHDTRSSFWQKIKILPVPYAAHPLHPPLLHGRPSHSIPQKTGQTSK